ncbi:MAG TPA: hypothetical protein VK586_10605 [Streptosporangiaceae bacterium]|nr:hypothetical protein [Streptosporangiaceae bacterium]
MLARHPEEDDTNRREILASMTAAGLTLAGMPLPSRLHLPGKVNPEHIGQVRQLTETYRGWVYQHGASGQLQRSIARLLDHATGMIARASDPQLRLTLLDATADVANLAAYACRDLGLHAYAQQHYLLSLQAAQAAGDHALAGHAVVRMAGHHIELAQPHEVLAYLDAARKTTRFTAGERSNQYAIEAWARAQSAMAQGVHRAVGHAEEESGRADDRSGPGWRVRHVAEAELYSLTGAGYAELARHDPAQAPEAIRRLTAALDLRGIDGARNATLDRISLAEAHLAAHNLTEALHAGNDAVDSASHSSSRRVRVRLDELARQLHPHHTHAHAAEVIHKISFASNRQPETS